MKTKLLKIEDIEFDEEIYPRTSKDWQNVYDYSESLKTGAVFPPITVALFNRKYVLIDGKLRIEAYKLNKEEYIQANVLTNLSKKKMYEEAVRRNVKHGRQLSPQEKRIACLRLLDFKYTTKEVSEIVQIPLDKLTSFTAESLTNTITGRKIVLKAPLQHLSGSQIDDEVVELQKGMFGYSQIALINNVLHLVENDLLDLQDKKIRESVSELYVALDKLMAKVKAK